MATSGRWGQIVLALPEAEQAGLVPFCRALSRKLRIHHLSGPGGEASQSTSSPEPGICREVLPIPAKVPSGPPQC